MSREGIIIGFHAVEELLLSDVTIGKVYVNNQADKQKNWYFETTCQKVKYSFSDGAC